MQECRIVVERPQRDSLTADRLREVLAYNHETGGFTWRIKVSGRTVGEIAGGVDERGYVRIVVDGHRYKAHRLAWLYVHGKWPEGVIDHINCDFSDNRISNIRDIPQAANTQNRRKAHKNNRQGLIGAHRDKTRFRSSIHVGGRQIFLGMFDTAEDAHHAYLDAKRQLHEGCTL